MSFSRAELKVRELQPIKSSAPLLGHSSTYENHMSGAISVQVNKSVFSVENVFHSCLILVTNWCYTTSGVVRWISFLALTENIQCMPSQYFYAQTRWNHYTCKLPFTVFGIHFISCLIRSASNTLCETAVFLFCGTDLLYACLFSLFIKPQSHIPKTTLCVCTG